MGTGPVLSIPDQVENQMEDGFVSRLRLFLKVLLAQACAENLEEDLAWFY